MSWPRFEDYKLWCVPYTKNSIIAVCPDNIFVSLSRIVPSKFFSKKRLRVGQVRISFCHVTVRCVRTEPKCFIERESQLRRQGYRWEPKTQSVLSLRKLNYVGAIFRPAVRVEGHMCQDHIWTECQWYVDHYFSLVSLITIEVIIDFLGVAPYSRA